MGTVYTIPQVTGEFTSFYSSISNMTDAQRAMRDNIVGNGIELLSRVMKNYDRIDYCYYASQMSNIRMAAYMGVIPSGE